jgi:hypothetical protein
MPVDAAASEEAMLDHALGEPENGHRQCDKEQNPPHFKPWRPSP